MIEYVMPRMNWMDTLNTIENEEKLVIAAYSKEDIEFNADVSLTDEQWEIVRHRFNKCSLSETSDLLCEIAREVVTTNNN